MTRIQTVLGEIGPEQLGHCQPHEHLLCDTYWVTGSQDHLLNDEQLAVEELLLYRRAGGGAIVDCTNGGLGRDPLALRRISEATGVHVVMGSGWYRQPFYPPEIDRRTTNDLAEEIVRDLVEGAGDTGVRAGIIGEIGAHLYWLTAGEERVHRAAARAQRRTGAPLMTHGEGSPVGLAQLDVFAEEGADLGKVAVGHADSFLDWGYHEEIVRRGAYLSFDGVGRKHLYPDARRVGMLARLTAAGYAGRVLLATDRCFRSDLHAYGGVGYDYVLTTFLGMLREAGISEDAIRLMTVENPRRFLAW